MVPFKLRANDKSVPLSHFSVPFIPPVSFSMEHKVLNFEDQLPQLQSPWFKLPAELRNQIYALSLTSSSPIVDPCNPPSYSEQAKSMNLETTSHQISYLSTPLLRTCKRIYAELDISTLYSGNTFRFTTSFSAQSFLSSLPRVYAEKIHDIEVDLREVSEAHTAVDREWVHWLSATPANHFWGAKVGSMNAVVPNLKTLRFNIERWRHTESIRSVAILKEILQGPTNLERVVMTGADGSELLFGGKDRFTALWGPAVWIGVMRFARLTGMVEWLAGCVVGEKDEKVVMWEKLDQRIILEIMSANVFRRQYRFRSIEPFEFSSNNSGNGCLTLADYERRWHSGEWPNSVKS